MSQSVLIIDDLPVNTRVLSSILEKSGYETVAAHSGKDALAIVENTDFDCILLDIVMPDMDGFEVIRRLKSIAKTSEVPVIFITGKEGSESVARGFELGAVDYITKPFNKVEVMARLKAHIKLYSTIKSLENAQAETLQQINEAQNSLLKQPDDLLEAHFSVLYKSLHAAGGDIYDIIKITENMYGYFVGDFAGHKISTSFLTSSVKALLHQNCNFHNSPVESMRMINSVLVKLMNSGQYMTGCYALIDRLKNTLTVVSMGHPPLIFIPRHGNARLVGKGGDILGVFEQCVFRKSTLDIYPGDRILLYTDGLIEGERVWSAEVDSLLAAVRKHRYSENRSVFIDNIFKETVHQRGELDDDVMVLVADFPGNPPRIDAQKNDNEICYKFHALRRLIDPAVQSLEKDIAMLTGVTQQYGIKLVLYEALGNAVIHGSKEQSDRFVYVCVSYRKNSLCIKITDEGTGFDWRSYLHKMNPDSGSLEKMPSSGRGLQVFTDYGFDFSFNDTGNTLYLEKKLP
jgi:sigma-B regulation protein RsbU (phosphoserine phosphatase)